MKLIGLVGAVILISTVYQSRKKSGIKTLTKAEGQKVIDENMDWLKARWDRVQKEKDSGVLRTVQWWYFDEATERQLGRIKKIGLNIGRAKVTKGQASDIIGLYEAPEAKDLAVLKRHNVPLEGMNETKARELAATVNLSPDQLKVSGSAADRKIENKIIKALPNEFIYLVRFFDSRIRYNDTKPLHVPIDDHYRKRYEQAVQLELALPGIGIPLEEKLKTLKLVEMSALAKGQKFTRKIPAIEFLMDIPDIVHRFEEVTPIDDWFQLKEINLDTEYLEAQWTKLHGEDDY